MSFQLETGDILSCYSGDRVPRFISWVTMNPFAPKTLKYGPGHVATIVEYEDQKVWAESTTLVNHPCTITERDKPRGCQAHNILDRVHDYREQEGNVYLYRLSPINTFTASEKEIWNSVLIDYFIKNEVNYDMGGALISGTRIISRTDFLPSDALSSVFCSELIAACLMRVCRLVKGNPTRYNPSTLLRKLVKDGTYEYKGEIKVVHGTLTLVT